MIDLALLVWSAAAAVLGNAAYLAALIAACRRKAPSAEPDLESLPALTIVRPLKGLEDGAEGHHESLFGGRLQPEAVLFVVESESDPAVEAVRPVVERHPDRARLLTALPAPGVLSGKVRNMMTGWSAARTPLVGFCDSDITLDRGHLADCVSRFADPNVAAASLPILYVAEGVFGRLSMLIMTIDNATLVRSASRTDIGAVTLGGLMIFRRDALEAVGGPEALGDALADDVRAGELIHKAGGQIRLAERPLVHNSGPEPALGCLARHHRWLTSIRTELPLFFWLQALLLNPIAATLTAGTVLSATGSPWAATAWAIAAASALLRTITAFATDRALLRPHGVGLGAWCLARAAADILYLMVLLTTLLVPFVYWRGRWFRTRWGSGRILREIQRGADTARGS